jgi:hypothetical protein
MGFDDDGRTLGQLKSTGLRPKFLEAGLARRAGGSVAVPVREVPRAMIRRRPSRNHAGRIDRLAVLLAPGSAL